MSLSPNITFSICWKLLFSPGWWCFSVAFRSQRVKSQLKAPHARCWLLTVRHLGGCSIWTVSSGAPEYDTGQVDPWGILQPCAQEIAALPPSMGRIGSCTCPCNSVPGLLPWPCLCPFWELVMAGVDMLLVPLQPGQSTHPLAISRLHLRCSLLLYAFLQLLAGPIWMGGLELKRGCPPCFVHPLNTCRCHDSGLQDRKETTALRCEPDALPSRCLMTPAADTGWIWVAGTLSQRGTPRCSLQRNYGWPFRQWNSLLIISLSLFLNILFTHLLERERERQQASTSSGEGQREKQALCEEPSVGLHPKTPGSWPELKVDAQPLSHPGAPFENF